MKEIKVMKIVVVRKVEEIKKEIEVEIKGDEIIKKKKKIFHLLHIIY